MTQRKKDYVKQDIRRIYDRSKQNYSAPKIAAELRKIETMIPEHTIDKHMREMGLHAQ